jgi:diaminopimelate decarboxylase
VQAFHYQDNRLFAEQVPLAAIADRHGTPSYVYSRAALESHWRAFDDALAGVPHRICYSVKANSNLGVLDVLARLGSGFDIVSVGELERVLAAGGDAAKVVFSGVGKGEAEMRRALEAGVHCFNIESDGELERLAGIAASLGAVAPISVRVNPDVDADTHPYIATGLKENKFGVPIGDAPALLAKAAGLGSIAIKGVDFHIGSQLTSLEPFIDALDRALALIDTLAASGIAVSHLNVGGGLGVRYGEETPPSASDYGAAIAARIAGRELELLVEPGRAIAAESGVLLARVEYLKLGGERNFAVVDAAMNDLLRPALYGAWQEILRTGVRVRGLPRQGPATRRRRRGFDRGRLRRSLQLRDELQLQHTPAGGRGDGGRRGDAPRAGPRAGRGPLRGRVPAPRLTPPGLRSRSAGCKMPPMATAIHPSTPPC